MNRQTRKGIQLSTSDRPFYPKKRFGQNFLIDPNVKERLIVCCQLTGNDSVLEIGPGLGAMTGLIIPCVKDYIGVEIDRNLATELKEKHKGEKNVAIVEDDFLKFSLDKLPPNTKIIGNLPYYISTPIIEKILTARSQISEAYLTIQLELGQRIVAQPNTKVYGSFTCFVQYHAKAEILTRIKSTAFRPIPGVQSCFLKLTPLQSPTCAAKDEEHLFRLIQMAFQQRRKTIQKSLEQATSKENLSTALNQLEISPQNRAENLTLKNYIDLSNFLFEREKN